MAARPHVGAPDGTRKHRYEQAFRDNDIDAEVLPDLTAHDLISIGVTSVGHRRELLAAIAALGAEVPNATVMTASRDVPAPADAERRQLTVMFGDRSGVRPRPPRRESQVRSGLPAGGRRMRTLGPP
jgi:hypothetical protein